MKDTISRPLTLDPLAYLTDAEGDSYPLSWQTIVLGRASECAVPLKSRKASRQHAEIYLAGDQFFVKDLGSKNGTFVNQHRVIDVFPIQEGDRLRCGQEEFYFSRDSIIETTETVSNYAEPASLLLDFDSMEVYVGSQPQGKPLSPPLTPLEWKLLAHLYRFQGKVCTRDAIFTALYDLEDPNAVPLDSAVETLVSRLRKRLGMNNPQQLPYLRAVRGVGYRLDL